MVVAVPKKPKIYHIVHVNRLQSIINDGYLWCDAEIAKRDSNGSVIGMHKIKQRRLNLFLTNYPDMAVGDCVPFYFCPRSVMLHVIYKANHAELGYRGGQGSIIHLESDLYSAVAWAAQNNKRWAFTLSNAGANYFEDRIDLAQLNEVNWAAVAATDWREAVINEGKQAEFLMEQSFPWDLVERIGVHSPSVYQQVLDVLSNIGKSPSVHVAPMWYY